MFASHSTTWLVRVRDCSATRIPGCHSWPTSGFFGVGSYLSAEVQLAYYTAPPNRLIVGTDLACPLKLFQNPKNSFLIYLDSWLKKKFFFWLHICNLLWQNRKCCHFSLKEKKIYRLSYITVYKTVPWHTHSHRKMLPENHPASYIDKRHHWVTEKRSSSAAMALKLNEKHLCKCKRGNEHFYTENRNSFLR